MQADRGQSELLQLTFYPAGVHIKKSLSCEHNLLHRVRTNKIDVGHCMVHKDIKAMVSLCPEKMQCAYHLLPH